MTVEPSIGQIIDVLDRHGPLTAIGICTYLDLSRAESRTIARLIVHARRRGFPILLKRESRRAVYSIAEQAAPFRRSIATVARSGR